MYGDVHTVMCTTRDVFELPASYLVVRKKELSPKETGSIFEQAPPLQLRLLVDPNNSFLEMI